VLRAEAVTDAFRNWPFSDVRWATPLVASPPLVPAQSPARTVLCHGVFDLLHLGHIRHLQEARGFGDRLIVSVSADRHVGKGMGRPHFTAAQRVEAIKALACVDEAFVNDDEDAIPAIERLRPAFYVKGADYSQQLSLDKTAAIDRELAAVQAVGGTFRFTMAELWSSSRLIVAEKFSPELVAYLAKARAAGFRDRILAAFERADRMSIAFVGETIIDEYRYVEALGKASKEFILTTVETGMESFEGGVKVASRHGEWPTVRCITPKETITKTRYMTAEQPHRKLISVYSAKEIACGQAARADLDEEIERAVQECDAVVVMDFGHGFIRRTERGLLRNAKFLALNVQSNAGNYGFNPVTSYKCADYICIDAAEARLATGMADEPVVDVMMALRARINCGRFLVTQGCRGAAWTNSAFSEITNTSSTWAPHGDAPAFTVPTSDTMGAGDAALALTAPLVAAGLGLEEAAFVGNIAGAIKSTIFGHRAHVGRREVVATVEALLK
jgi:cytidyltransferase-like protein